MTKLSEYAKAANSLRWPEFAYRHPDRVLILLPSGDLSASSVQTMLDGETIEVRPDISDDYRVRPLKKRFGGHPFEMFITAGRAGNNDIVLNDIEVSKVHAYFEEDAQGNWTVRDANSTNGTFVNAQRVEPDQKILIRSSDTLKFSAGVSAVYFDTADFYQFLRSKEVVDAFLNT